MTSQWKSAALGGVIGAALALVIVFASAWLGYFPGAGDKAFRAYLLNHPEVIAEVQDRLQVLADQQDQRRRQEAVERAGANRFFSPEVAFVTGPANAKTTFVEFFDYNCPHCRNAFPAVKRFYEQHKNDTRFAFIEFPIQGQPSIAAARAAIAARKQPGKYLSFHFAMMSEKNVVDSNTAYADAQKAGLNIEKMIADMKDPAIDKQIAAAHKLADDTAIDGTPTFIINGRQHAGEVDDATLKQLAER